MRLQCCGQFLVPHTMGQAHDGEVKDYGCPTCKRQYTVKDYVLEILERRLTASNAERLKMGAEPEILQISEVGAPATMQDVASTIVANNWQVPIHDNIIEEERRIVAEMIKAGAIQYEIRKRFGNTKGAVYWHEYHGTPHSHGRYRKEK